MSDAVQTVRQVSKFFGGLTAAEFLIDRARLAAGERVLIAGATGAVGGAAVQIARHIGAEVAATASPANHALARQLGATEVTDYRTGPPKGPFDVILDVMGYFVRRPDDTSRGRIIPLVSPFRAFDTRQAAFFSQPLPPA